MQRDPVWDAGNFGGQYSFAWNGPVSGLDPLGTDAIDWLMESFSKEATSYKTDSTAVATVQGFIEGLGDVFVRGENPFKQSHDAEQQRLVQAAEQFGDRGDTFSENAAGLVGVLVSDVTGGTEGYEAVTGDDTTRFAATGFMCKLSAGERAKRGGLAAIKALGAYAQVSSLRAGLQGLRGGATAATPRPPTGAYSEGAQGGTGFGRLAGKEIGVTDKGVAAVERHLAQFGDVAENTSMIDRLGQAVAEGRNLTGADASFYLHELREAHLMGRGLGYDAAHAASLERYQVSPFSVYAREIVQSLPASFNNNWRAFWGLTPR